MKCDGIILTGDRSFGALTTLAAAAGQATKDSLILEAGGQVVNLPYRPLALRETASHSSGWMRTQPHAQWWAILSPPRLLFLLLLLPRALLTRLVVQRRYGRLRKASSWMACAGERSGDENSEKRERGKRKFKGIIFWNRWIKNEQLWIRPTLGGELQKIGSPVTRNPRHWQWY